MTEDEAKTKWCPFARLITTENGSTAMRMGTPTGWNRYSGTPAELCTASLCIASACMAWSWHPNEGDESLIEAIRRHRDEHDSGLLEAKRFVEQNPSYRRKATAPGSGYCGLAGAPQ